MAGIGPELVCIHLFTGTPNHQLGYFVLCTRLVYLYYRPYPLFKQAVQVEDWPAAGAALNRVRHVILVNLIIGLILLVIVFAGRYGFFTSI